LSYPSGLAELHIFRPGASHTICTTLKDDEQFERYGTEGELCPTCFGQALSK
jgi:hypothetical protein